MDAHDCPSHDRLDAFARGEPLDDPAAAHIASCETCQHAVEEIRTNNSFLEIFAGVLPDGRSGGSGSGGGRNDEPPPPDVLPGYRIEGEMYRGGQGIVYRATQIRTKRPVAFKMLLRGSLATTRQRLRFEREAEIVAALRHPGIVTVYDAGYLPDGRFGFAMELIEGVTLDRWSGDDAVTSKDQLALRLRLFTAICDAASFAHQHGVIHRDLKPANILVDAEGRPHILDFGIAKAFESDAVAPLIFGGPEAQAASDKASAHQTLPGEFAGTPAYASPEQVSGDPRAIDTRTDVYSLGVILYQLMTGRLPYSVEGSLREVVERITHHKPTPPSAEVPVLDDDIDAIVLRALHKDKERRYASVADLARDVELFLEGRPIETRRDSAWYVVRKTVRRHWVVTSSAAAAVLVLAVFSIAMTLLYSQKTAAEVETRQQLRRLNVEFGRAAGLSGEGAIGLDLLWRAQLVPEPGTSPPSPLRFGNAFEPLDSYWALWEFYAQNPCERAVGFADDFHYAGAVSPDGDLLATINESRVRIWTLPEFRLFSEFPLPSPVRRAVFAADGQSLLTLSQSRLARWSLAEGTLIREDSLAMSMAYAAEDISSNGTAAFAREKDNTLRILRPTDPPETLDLDAGVGSLRSVRFNTDGSLLASVSVEYTSDYASHSTISVWSMPEGVLLARTQQAGHIIGLLFSPDSRAVVMTNADMQIQRWEYQSQNDPVTLITASHPSSPQCWFGEPPLLVTVESDRTIRLWDLDRGRLAGELAGHADWLRTVGTLADRSTLVSIGDHSVMFWEEHTTTPWKTLNISKSGLNSTFVSFSPDGQTLAQIHNTIGSYRVMLSDVETERDFRLELEGHDDFVSSVSFSHDGALLASADYEGVVCVWDTADGALLERFTNHTSKISSVTFSPVAHLLAFTGAENTVVLHDLDTGRVRTLVGHTGRIPSVSFSPDGRVLASASVDGTVRLWETATGKALEVLRPHNGRGVRVVLFSPDGTKLTTGGDDAAIALTDLRSGEVATLRGHSGDIFALSFGPEGRVLVSGDRAGTLMLWDVEHHTRLATLPKHRDMIMSISISPDGATMLTSSAGSDPEVRLWDLGAFAPHIAGNLEFHAARLEGTFGREPANLAPMRRWASEVRGLR